MCPLHSIPAKRVKCLVTGNVLELMTLVGGVHLCRTKTIAAKAQEELIRDVRSFQGSMASGFQA
jgi:hypothetical protein